MTSSGVPTHIIQAAPAIVYVYDVQQQRSRFQNRPLADVLGYSSNADVARGATEWRELIHPDDVAQFPAYQSRLAALKSDEAATFEYRLRGADGTWRWMHSRDVPYEWDSTGRLLTVIGTAFDITDQKRLEARLREHEAALREADQRKDEFIATLAHELRQPLAPIRTAAALLVPSAPSTTLARCQAIIERQIGHMARLLDDLQDISRLSVGKVALRPETVLLGDLISMAVESIRPQLDAAGHALAVTVAPALAVNGDPTRLTQIVSNLLTNAIKYTNAGGNISLSALPSAHNAVLEVRDDGIGMTAEQAASAFDLFAQATPGASRGQGMGIGLALVKTLVELHGGSVELRSDGPGLGTTVRVRLPLVHP